MHFSKCHGQMFLDGRRILTSACLLIAALTQVSGEETRKSRSINDRVYQPRQTYRSNNLHFEDRDYNHRQAGSDNSIRKNYRDGSRDDENSRKFHDEEDKLFDVIMSKDYGVSTPSEIEKFDRIGEQMIARANITEEAKRVVRQVKKQRPGFFWTLARVAFETVNETKSAIEQISILVANNIAPETTTVRGGTSASLMNDATTTQRVDATSETNSMETTTTEETFRLTTGELQSLIRRNLRGLVRLFNIEWRDALNQSQTNVREFQRDLSNKISPFLKDNPDVV